MSHKAELDALEHKEAEGLITTEEYEKQRDRLTLEHLKARADYYKQWGRVDDYEKAAAAVVALILEPQSRLQAQILLFGDEFAGVEFGDHLHLLLEEFAGALLEILVSELLELLLVLLLSCESLLVVLLLQCRGGLLVVVDAPPLLVIVGSGFEVLECEAVALLLVLLGGDEPLGLFVFQRVEFGFVALVDFGNRPVLGALLLLVGVLVELVLPLLPLIEIAGVEIALALEGLFVVLRHGVVVLFGGDEPLRELHLELVVGFAVLLVYLDDELLSVFEFLLLELVYLRTFLLVGGAVWCVGAASGVVGGEVGGLLIDEFAVKVLDLVVPLDKVVELIDLLGGFVQLSLRGIEGVDLFLALSEFFSTQFISFVFYWIYWIC